MSAQLIWITPDAEKTMEYCARASSPKNQKRMEEGELSPGKLLRFCAEHKHWSVFEMASACIGIRTTRDVARQIIRHRSFSFQEFSQRYAFADLSNFVYPEMRKQAKENRQSSIRDISAQEAYKEDVIDTLDKAFDLYDRMVEFGVAKETARRILPECTPTNLYMNGTIRSWIHYLETRCSEETQSEHREIAFSIRNLLARNLPIIASTFSWKEVVNGNQR